MTAKTQSPNGDTNAEQSTNELSRRRFLGNVGLVAASTAGAATGVASAQEASEWQTGRDGLAWDSDFVQNPYFAEDTLTKAKHRLEWGTDDAALTAVFAVIEPTERSTTTTSPALSWSVGTPLTDCVETEVGPP